MQTVDQKSEMLGSEKKYHTLSAQMDEKEDRIVKPTRSLPSDCRAIAHVVRTDLRSLQRALEKCAESLDDDPDALVYSILPALDGFNHMIDQFHDFVMGTLDHLICDGKYRVARDVFGVGKEQVIHALERGLNGEPISWIQAHNSLTNCLQIQLSYFRETLSDATTPTSATAPATVSAVAIANIERVVGLLVHTQKNCNALFVIFALRHYHLDARVVLEEDLEHLRSINPTAYQLYVTDTRDF
jgi:hypothetical protein